MSYKVPSITFSGRLGVQQRVLPTYRIPFFDALAQACLGGLSIFAGMPGREESIVTAHNFQHAHYFPALNRHFFRNGSPYYFCWQSGLAGWLESWQPDILIIEANPRHPSTRLAIRWMRARRRPVIGWGLGSPEVESRSFVGRMFAGIRGRERISLLKSLDWIIAYSQRGAQEYHHLGFPGDRITVAPNAVASRPVLPPPQRPLLFNGLPTVLFVGRLLERKRVDCLLRACADLHAITRLRLQIVGDGPATESLKALAARIYPSAEFVGEKHGSELVPYFQSADIFVLPGTGGLAVQEAMAYGLPVIVAEGDGTQTDLVHPGNGWIVPPNDPVALQEAIQVSLSDVLRLRKMGDESYRIVCEEVNLEIMVFSFIQAIQHASPRY